MAIPSTTELINYLRKEADRPFQEAHAMHPGLYRSEGILTLEAERIFLCEWLCVGRSADIPNVGDYLTFSIGDQPIFTIRASNSEIKSYANVCLHRMMRLLEDRGNCKRIVCPYHAWTYDPEGRLIGAPYMGKSTNFTMRNLHLPAVRTEIWHGWIYVTLAQSPLTVAERLKPLEGIVERYNMEHYLPVATANYVWDTNWKLLTENFMEGYHLPVAHRQTVGAWFASEESDFPAEAFEHFTYQTFAKNEHAKYGRAHKDNVSLDGRWRYTSVMPTVYPTHMYVLAPDHLWYLSLRPRGVGRVNVRFGVALAPEVVASQADIKGFVSETLSFFDRVNAEDKFVVEGIYAGARAPLSKPGRLCWMEREIHDFMRYLARRLTPG
jgi:phenylpropionate dioxygenase-like ring-hydroxylating dioxygenase large terminal subunit